MFENIFRMNDIRGVYGQELDDSFAYKTGRAISKFLKCKKIIIGRDMRLSSNLLFNALAKGFVDSGINVMDIGLIDTPALYFASAFYKTPGIMITASHNPAEYNGIKIVKANARPIDMNNGLDKIKKFIEKDYFSNIKIRGEISKRDVLKNYKKHILSFVNPGKIGNLKIAVDAGNGMAGRLVPFIYKGLDIRILPLYFKLDGKFPNHVPNPILKDNMKSLRKMVLKDKADFGIAFDGDMDRVAFVDEKGQLVSTSFIGALLAKYLLQEKKRKENIVYTSACSKIISETISKYSGKSVRAKVGHAFMKESMYKNNALLGVEHSGHYYYRDNYYADAAVISSLLVLEIYSHSKKNGIKFSDLIAEFNKYSQSEERSIKLKDKGDIVDKIKNIIKIKNREK